MARVRTGLIICGACAGLSRALKSHVTGLPDASFARRNERHANPQNLRRSFLVILPNIDSARRRTSRRLLQRFIISRLEVLVLR